MQVYLGHVVRVIDSKARLVECNLGYSNNNLVARFAFSHVDIKPNDRVIVFVSGKHGFMEAVALPLENKFDHTLDSVKLSYEDNYLDISSSDLALQIDKTISVQMDDTGFSVVKTTGEVDKVSGEIYVSDSVVELYKSDDSSGNVKAAVRAENEALYVSKGSNVGKEGDSTIKMEDDKITVTSQEVKIPGMPKVDTSQSKGGFCQILFCPLTGLPHNTESILGTPGTSSNSGDIEELRPKIKSRRNSRSNL